MDIAGIKPANVNRDIREYRGFRFGFFGITDEAGLNTIGGQWVSGIFDLTMPKWMKEGRPGEMIIVNVMALDKRSIDAAWEATMSLIDHAYLWIGPPESEQTPEQQCRKSKPGVSQFS